jgi:hypothetical protein
VIGGLALTPLDAVLARADDLLRALTEPDCKRRLRDGNAWLGGTA